MNIFSRTLNKIFKSTNQQELDKIQNLIQAINEKESEAKSLSEGDFKKKHSILKKMPKVDY
jgi:preprotein translocase subunit SecA